MGLIGRTFSRHLIGAAALAAGVALGACGGGATADRAGDAPAASPQESPEPRAETSSAPEAAVTVTMRYAVLKPRTVRIKVGEAVTWRNDDSETHGPLFIFVDGDSMRVLATRGGPLLINQEWTYVFEEPGRYEFVDKGTALDVTLSQWIHVSK